MLRYLINRVLKKSRLVAVRNSSIGFDSKIESGSTFIDSHLGRHSFVGYDCNINNTQIDSFCSIASNVNIGGAAHPMQYLSTSPVFLSHRDSVKVKYARHEFKHIPKTEIGSDVWIGQGVFIKSGIKIGHGAVIGMGAVVTKNVAAYEVVAGNPAKHVRYRFNEDIVTALLQLSWWNFDDKELKDIGPYIKDPVALLRSRGLL